MWTSVREDLPPEGVEVLFVTKRDKQKVLGQIYYAKEARTLAKVPFVKIKSYSFTMAISHEIMELDCVTLWTYLPEDPPEEVIERFDLMEF